MKKFNKKGWIGFIIGFLILMFIGGGIGYIQYNQMEKSQATAPKTQSQAVKSNSSSGGSVPSEASLWKEVPAVTDKVNEEPVSSNPIDKDGNVLDHSEKFSQVYTDSREGVAIGKVFDIFTDKGFQVANYPIRSADDVIVTQTVKDAFFDGQSYGSLLMFDKGIGNAVELIRQPGVRVERVGLLYPVSTKYGSGNSDSEAYPVQLTDTVALFKLTDKYNAVTYYAIELNNVIVMPRSGDAYVAKPQELKIVTLGKINENSVDKALAKFCVK